MYGACGDRIIDRSIESYPTYPNIPNNQISYFGFSSFFEREGRKFICFENIKDILFLMVGFSRYRWFWKNRFALGLLVNRSMPSHVISLVKANSDEYLVRSDFVATTNPSIYVLKWEIITSN